MDETVGESGGAGSEAPVPPSRGQEAEQVVHDYANSMIMQKKHGDKTKAAVL